MNKTDKIQRLRQEIRELREELDYYESPLHDDEQEPVGVGEAAIILVMLISLMSIVVGICAYIPKTYAPNILIPGVCGFALGCLFFFAANVDDWAP